MEKKDAFCYTYSAKQQAEIRAIRKKYAAPQEAEDKMTQLRRLDEGVTGKATAVALVLGILGALVLGFGMSMIMTQLGKTLGLSAAVGMWIGIPVGILGIVLVSLAYPLYNVTLKKERKRVAPEILRLSEELLK